MENRIENGKITIKDRMETLYDKTATPLGNSAKVDGPARFSGKRWYVIILNDLRLLYQHPRFQATFRI